VSPRVTGKKATGEATASLGSLGYEDLREGATGPGAAEWKQADKARAGLTEFYNQLREDPRITDLARSEQAWARYEKVKAEVERLAPEAREKMTRSAESLEGLSIPVPEKEPLLTTDTQKLNLTQGEASRIYRKLDRAGGAVKGTPFAPDRASILKQEYAEGLATGGPKGGAVVRAVVEIARDMGLDIHQLVDEHRKEYHHGALQDAQQAMMRSQSVGRSVSKPPFPPPEMLQQDPKGIGTYRSPAMLAQRSPSPRPGPSSSPGSLRKLFKGGRRPRWK
jgi:hypothetical protein